MKSFMERRREWEISVLLTYLRESNWNINKAAQAAHMDRGDMYHKLQRLGLIQDPKTREWRERHAVLQEDA